MSNPFSLLRSLTAAFRIDQATMKRDAKRLQRATGDVFGQSFPLQTCQEAVARMRGAKSWNDALQLSSRAAKTLPTWFTASQNDVYQAALEALTGLEVETREDAACLFAGSLQDSAVPALALWAAEMVWRKVPGLILVDTQRSTVQDTPIWAAATKLDLVDVLHSCRFLDMRQARCPVGLSADGRSWIRSLGGALGSKHARALESSGINAAVHSLLAGLGRFRSAAATGHRDEGNGDPLLSLDLVVRAVNFARYSGADLPPELQDDAEADSIRHDLRKYLRTADLPPDVLEAFDALAELVEALGQKQCSLGKVLSQESLWRPTVVLFSSDDPASSALASVVHSLYYWRFVGHELRYSGIEPRPVLFFGDTDAGALPHWLIESFMARTILAPGSAFGVGASMPDYLRGSVILVECENGTVSASGRKLPLA